VSIDWRRRSYTKEEFTNAWQTSLSIAEVIRKLNLKAAGGGYISLKIAAEDLGLNSDHMTGQGWNVGKRYRKFSKIRPLEEVLIENSDYLSTYRLKSRLYREGLKEKKCEWCGIVEWREKPAPLALDHANGNRRDNRLINLRILCYNCHGQTNTFAGKNKGK
jgi:hypothetical protein